MLILLQSDESGFGCGVNLVVCGSTVGGDNGSDVTTTALSKVPITIHKATSTQRHELDHAESSATRTLFYSCESWRRLFHPRRRWFLSRHGEEIEQGTLSRRLLWEDPRRICPSQPDISFILTPHTVVPIYFFASWKKMADSKPVTDAKGTPHRQESLTRIVVSFMRSRGRF